jgi:predicted transcriptional regulator YdeE
VEKTKTQLDSLTLVGLTARTNNENEMNPESSKIAKLAGLYWGDQIANNFKHRTSPMVTYAAYTEYESDENGDYTYFIGERVDSLDDQDLSQFQTITLLASKYQKLTTAAGKIPDIIISAWQEIWTMNESDFGGKRRYIADFEVFDQRAADPNNAVIDIYIGIED